jgi:2-polyprenyl-6-methoxyphenol hydroxylase-like FAD-dependent oxidoreductase
MLELAPAAGAPVELTGGVRDGDERYVTITGRRPVFEAIIARAAAAEDGLTIRRGSAVTNLLTKNGSGPHQVVGVRTEAGDELLADLVVDAGGRRSAFPRLLAEAGAAAPVEEAEDSGFTYYGRYFRSGDGSIPPNLGPLIQANGSISVLTLPCDHGNWGVALVAVGGDALMRKVKDADTWDRVLAAHPLVAHWADGEVTSDVITMANIEDRIRRYVVDGTPAATGLAAIGDAWSCTNPSVGRGASIGLVHSVALRDALREDPASDPMAWALAWDALTTERVLPWYEDTLMMDRHRVAEMQAHGAGETYETDDERYRQARRLDIASGFDPDLFRASLDVGFVYRTRAEVLSDPAVAARVDELGSVTPEPLPGPDRAELVELIG